MQAAVSDKVAVIESTAVAFGTRLEKPLSLFKSTFDQASKVEATSAEERTSDLYTSLISTLGLVEDLQEALEDADVLFQHISAIIEATAAFAWVVSEDPVEHMKAAITDANEPVMALRKKTDPSHSEFADAIDAFMHTMSDYVVRNHPGPLTYVDASGPDSADTPSEAASHTAQHLSDFRNAVTDATAKHFQRASDAVSPDVATMATTLVTALYRLYDFLVQASVLPKMPSDGDRQAMVQPVASCMAMASEISRPFSPSSSYYAHIKAIEESMAMFSWIVADKTPVSFVSDAEAASAFYSTKILVATKRASDAPVHKRFVDSLNAIFSSMRDYIKQHYATGMRYGIGVEAVSDSKTELTSPVSPAADETDVDDDNYVSSFKRLISGPVDAYVASSATLGGPVLEQAKIFKEAWLAEADFLSVAIKTPKPADVQPMLLSIAEKMGKVSEIAQSADPRAPLTHHLMAVSEAIPAIGWVAVDEKAAVYVGDMSSAGQFFLDKVKMAAKNSNNPSAHREWASALERVWSELKAYVKEHHTQALTWNPPKIAKPISRSRQFIEDDVSDNNDYVFAFNELITGPLEAFVKASNSVGDDVARQATSFANAWKAEADFLKKAISMDKPSDVSGMLSNISQHMEDVRLVTENADRHGPLTQHLNAVSESMAALGWVAVDEKATAFVGDMAGAGQFYIDKVKMGARRSGNPELHRDWAKRLETLWNDLKAYVKEHHTQKLVWNPPRKPKAAVRSRDASKHVGDEVPDDDYVTIFRKLIAGPLQAFLKASTAIGGDVEHQANLFADAWNAEADFLGKAINTPKPDDVQSMLTGIAEKMGGIAAFAESADPRGLTTQHLKAVSESMPALGWVAVDEKATVFVGDMSGAGQFYIDKVKINARNTDNPSLHREWAKSLETLWDELKAYVKEHHTQKLVWNPPKVKKPSRFVPATIDDGIDSGDYVSAFQDIITNQLTNFVEASNAIGGDVSRQAIAFSEAWKAEEDFLKKAIITPKPNDVQSLLTDIATKMGQVNAVTESADPRGPLTQHLNAVSESMPALGWVAVDEKATAFVGDMSGAGQFYIDKVKINARSTENPTLHREWAKCLESLWSELKAYVKEHHTQALVWNPPKKMATSQRAQANPKITSEAGGSEDYVTVFKQLIPSVVASFKTLSEAVGGDVATQAKLFYEAWEMEAEFLSKAINMRKPDDVQGMLGGLAKKMGDIGDLAQKADPRGPLTNHLLAVSESIAALGWVAVDEKATGFVGDMAGAGQFYMNKVKMSAKSTDNPELHREWAKGLERVWAELKAYVKEHHTQSLSWKR